MERCKKIHFLLISISCLIELNPIFYLLLGYKYLHSGRNLNRRFTYWKCSKFYQKCRASARIAKGQQGDVLLRGQIKSSISHNHQPENPKKQETEEMRAEIKRKIREKPDITLDELLENVSEEMLRAMNGKDAVRQMVYRLWKLIIWKIKSNWSNLREKRKYGGAQHGEAKKKGRNFWCLMMMEFGYEYFSF